MSAIQSDGDGTSANLAGMSKNELYDIMSQMKASQFGCFLVFCCLLDYCYVKFHELYLIRASCFSVLCADADRTEPATSQGNSRPESSID